MAHTIGAKNDAWLAQVTEEALEPDLPIIDAHHHLWDGREQMITPRYLFDELLGDIRASGHNIIATVYMEARSMYRVGVPDREAHLGEVEYVNGVAAQSASGIYGDIRLCHGIIGHADFEQGAEAGDLLDRAMALAPDRYRGVRQSVSFDKDVASRGFRQNPPHRYMDPKWREGYAELAKRGLLFEAWCYHPQLPELIDLARAFPDTIIVLNHFGGFLGTGPYAVRKAEEFAAWKASIDELAGCPNVVAKLGGYAMAINGFGWEERATPPTSDDLAAAGKAVYHHTMERFGLHRCVFESNFPVERESCSYGVLWNAFKKIASGCSAEEKGNLFAGNAQRLYRLEL